MFLFLTKAILSSTYIGAVVCRLKYNVNADDMLDTIINGIPNEKFCLVRHSKSL